LAKEEQVLVVERKVLEQVGMFNGLAFDVDRYLSKIFALGVPRFIPRSKAEKDPSYKQLIPYVIMTCDGKYLTYVRGKRADETRLVAKRSIGIGGHINPSEDMPLYEKLSETNLSVYLSAVRREVAEEVSIETRYKDKVVALLNDDSNEVGQVHLGIVHLWTLDEPKVNRREQMITQIDFKTAAELHQLRDTMETWSSLCLDGLNQMTKFTQPAL
jgi:predicted NUDIX family phosphoesterase